MKPLISVVVPTYRRAELLDRCLAALAKQHLPGSAFEIIVVHDGPSARTQRVAAHWRRQLGPSGPAIRYRSPRHLGPAAARNAGWRIARAEIVAFTDDDTEPDPQWLSRALEGFCDVGVGAAWGRIVMPLSGEPTDYELDAAGLTRAEFATANCFCRTTALRAIGGFDERFEIAWREDSDLFFRLLEHGASVVHLPDAVVVHPIRRAPWGVSIAQQKKILFDALLFKKHRSAYRQRIRGPRWDYYLIVASLAAAAIGTATDTAAVAVGAAAVWGALTARFCLARLRPARKRLSHVAEMVVTSVLIPPLAVFWRAVGALRFGVVFL